MVEALSNQEALMAIVNALNGVENVLTWIAVWLFLSLFFNK